MRTQQGKLDMFVAIDRTSQFAFVELHEKATTAISRGFLLRLIAAVPYKIHTVLTDGIQFTTPGAGGSAVPLIKETIANGERFWAMPSNWPAPGTLLLRETRPTPPASRRLHRGLQLGRRLKALKGLTPYEFICKSWATQPERFTLNPLHQMPGLNI